MNDYTIYCTSEQTRKAYELDAPLNFDSHIADLQNAIKISNKLYAEAPTAEQMIGWLEEQPIIERVDICCFMSWGYMIIRDDLVHPYVCVAKNENEGFSSRKEATLAAIDAALDYLVDNNLIK